jgi:hypothetical protein
MNTYLCAKYRRIAARRQGDRRARTRHAHRNLGYGHHRRPVRRTSTRRLHQAAPRPRQTTRPPPTTRSGPRSNAQPRADHRGLRNLRISGLDDFRIRLRHRDTSHLSLGSGLLNAAADRLSNLMRVTEHARAQDHDVHGIHPRPRKSRQLRPVVATFTVALGPALGCVCWPRPGPPQPAFAVCATVGSPSRTPAARTSRPAPSQVGHFLEVGTTGQFHVPDAVSADEDVRESLLSARGKGRPIAAIVSHLSGGLLVAGFVAARELGPVGGKNSLYTGLPRPWHC